MAENAIWVNQNPFSCPWVGMKPLMQEAWDVLLVSASESTFTHVYETTCARVQALCRRRLPDRDAQEEALARVFARLWEIVRSGQARPVLHPCVNAGLTRLVDLECDVLRKRHRRGTTRCRTNADDILYEIPAGLSSARKIIQDRQDQHTLTRAIAQLPQEMAEVILAYYFVGKTHDELAQELNLHPSSISKRLKKALQTLQTLLPPEVNERSDHLL